MKRCDGRAALLAVSGGVDASAAGGMAISGPIAAGPPGAVPLCAAGDGSPSAT